MEKEENDENMVELDQKGMNLVLLPCQAGEVEHRRKSWMGRVENIERWSLLRRSIMRVIKAAIPFHQYTDEGEDTWIDS